MQNYTSANTSINSTKVPAIFKKIYWTAGRTNLDLGGGKFDTATEYLERIGVTNLVCDPYNRSEEHNNNVLRYATIHGVDYCTISNVLNVIDSAESRQAVLRLAKSALKLGHFCFVAVYEGDRSGIGRATKKDCWQNNMRLKDYLGEVLEVFGNATIENNMIVAYKEV
jgi:hypothetical protein